jgi:hypothetical protein
MRAPLKMVTGAVLVAVALGWALRLHEPAQEPTATERTAARAVTEQPAPAPVTREPAQTGTIDNDGPIDDAARARFNEQAREFFAQAPSLPPEETRRRADLLSQELTRIERAGGLSAGETFLVRVGLIRATEPDEQQQAERLAELKQRYANETRHRTARADAQADPMFELYKVRESEIVAEVMSMATIPDGLTREEYLRRRLQQAREQLSGL